MYKCIHIPGIAFSFPNMNGNKHIAWLDLVSFLRTNKHSTERLRFSVYSLVSTEMFTRPSSRRTHVTHGNHFDPPRDIPEQLAAYSAQTLSTALFMLGTHLFQLGGLRQYGINYLAQGQTKVPRPGIEQATY